MDDALALVNDLMAKCKELGVLILVVMDDALARKQGLLPRFCLRGLNPCCNG